MRSVKVLVAIAVCCLVLPDLLRERSSAAPPWTSLVNFRRIDADPNKSYLLAEENGPWLIMAASFQGPTAADAAQELVYELRKRYKLPAFTHEKTYDFSKSFVGRGVDRYGRPRKMEHSRKEIIHDVAVLVGDFSTVDDPQAEKTLDRIKRMQPAVLSSEGGDAAKSFATFRKLHRRISGKKSGGAGAGPMRSAFIVANPLLPKSYFKPKGVDRFVEQMNRGVKFSLLDCPGKYTVRVATFRGNVLIDQGRIDRVQKGTATMKSRLEDAADKAHKLTIALREKGYQAYEYHDRHSSIVTVGGFDSVGSRLPGGQTQYDPDVRSVLRVFGPTRHIATMTKDGRPFAKPVFKPQHVLNIPLDLEPVPIEVPKRSFASDYARGAWPFK